MRSSKNFLAGLLFGALAAGLTAGATTAGADVINDGQWGCCPCCCTCGCPKPTPPWVDPMPPHPNVPSDPQE